jgi:hypothetical protein
MYKENMQIFEIIIITSNLGARHLLSARISAINYGVGGS